MTKFMRAVIVTCGLALLLFSRSGGLGVAQGLLPAPDKPAVEAVVEPDPLGRETPRGLVEGFLSALAAGDLAKAGRYLDLRAFPDLEIDWRGRELAGQLQRILDLRGQFLSFGELNHTPSGNVSDALDPGVDRIGHIRTASGTVPITATKIEQKDKPAIWLISADTIKSIPQIARGLGESVIDEMLPETLKANVLLGAPVGHWLALLVMMLLAVIIVALPAWLLTRYLDRLPEKTRHRREVMFFRALAMPAALMIATILVMTAAALFGVSIVARGYAGRLAEVLAWVAFAWLLWRLVDGVADITTKRMSRLQRSSGFAAIGLFRRGVKAVVVFFAILAGLDAFGVDMTTGIAALGIGGLALALGAQKTIENFVGSLTLVADQPIRVGDFCRFGEVLGTVEDIGMRSTRIRTLNRTVVTVPNGDFSSMQIENFTLRDRFLFKHELGLQYDTSPDQMQQVLTRLRQMLAEDHRVAPDTGRVRFIAFGADALALEIFAYVFAADWNAFLEVQEEFNLQIMGVVSDAGASFAFPSRTIYFGDQPPAIPQTAERPAAAGKRQKI